MNVHAAECKTIGAKQIMLPNAYLYRVAIRI